LTKKLLYHCLISAGPTREWIDPVRFISNPSSGKMGFALARAAVEQGMEVTLVTGPTQLPRPDGVKLVEVETALEMKEAMDSYFDLANLTIMSAAVSDHRPVLMSDKKINKDRFPMSLNLIKNPDILKYLGSKKRLDQVLVGFAAESHDVVQSATRKLNDKKLDWIVANDISNQRIGFSSDQNEVYLIGANGDFRQICLADKSIIAKEIMDAIYPTWLGKAH
jgi:phosphopantothenoylcysteine decarboxylase/phosphopantothenate--cysteine ligase